MRKEDNVSKLELIKEQIKKLEYDKSRFEAKIEEIDNIIEYLKEQYDYFKKRC